MEYTYRLSNDWECIDKLVIYGFGKMGVGNIDKLITEFKVPFIIDNNQALKGSSYRNVSIYDLESVGDKIANIKIVILAAGKALTSIKKSLQDIGLKEFENFASFDCFMVEWYWRFKKQCCLGKVTSSVTTRCTFKCKNCNLLMPYYTKAEDMSLKMLKRDVTTWFSLVDFVSAFVIVGGEPFLYRRLDEYVEYIGSRYRSRIGNLQIITNGKVTPKQQLFELIKEYNIEVRISDYTHILDYETQLNELKTKLNEWKIKHVVFKQTEWLDFGFPQAQLCIGNTREELRKHMLNCSGFCHCLQDGKYYYCGNAWAAQKCGLVQLKNSDYLELGSLDTGSTESKEKLIDFYLGNLEPGYMSFCKMCRGFTTDKVIPAAIQTNSEEINRIKNKYIANCCVK